MSRALHPAKPRVYLVQLGARRNYELVSLLSGGTELVRFATSLAWRDQDRASLLRRLIGTWRPGLARRRSIAGLAAGQLCAAPLADGVAGAAALLRLPTLIRRSLTSAVLGQRVRRDGWHGADVLFTVDGNGGFAMIEAARRAGLRVVADIVVTPKAYERMRAQDLLWPGYTNRRISAQDVARFEAYYARLAALSDLLICPSATVMDGIAAVAPEARGKCVHLPYGLSGYTLQPGTPTPGQVLFAGGDATRKGLPYLGQAATLLQQAGCAIEVRVAGGFSAQVRAQPECRDLVFLGKLGPAAMRMAYQTADVFCLPSLAEGSASVVLEAMSAAVPAVVTRAAGSPVDNGIEGIVIPESDPQALAAALRRIVEDRALRERMSQAALRRAGQHDAARLAPRLAETIAMHLATGKPAPAATTQAMA